MITLFAPSPIWGLPSLVPASMKLETWLRMAELPYEVTPPDISLAPKGKLPFVRVDGKLMGDSTLIIEHLTHLHGKDLDAGLSKKERAVSHAFRRMMKEHLYWVLIVERWMSDENFALYEPVFSTLFFSMLAPIQQHDMCVMIRQDMQEQLRRQGMGRHTAEEVAHFGIQDMKAISDWMEEKPFLMGDKPTLVDATVYAYVANILEAPFKSEVKNFGLATPNLLPYCERMRQRFFPELSK